MTGKQLAALSFGALAKKEQLPLQNKNSAHRFARQK
jgi:hypothetical protein